MKLSGDRYELEKSDVGSEFPTAVNRGGLTGTKIKITKVARRYAYGEVYNSEGQVIQWGEPVTVRFEREDSYNSWHGVNCHRKRFTTYTEGVHTRMILDFEKHVQAHRLGDAVSKLKTILYDYNSGYNVLRLLERGATPEPFEKMVADLERILE